MVLGRDAIEVIFDEVFRLDSLGRIDCHVALIVFVVFVVFVVFCREISKSLETVLV